MKANRAKDRLWEVRWHLQNRCFFFLNSTSSQCRESEAFDGFTLVMFSFSYFNKKRSELVVKTCFFDTSIFLNIKVGDLCNIVVFFTACEWRLKGVKITKQNWYSLNTWGTVNSLRGRKKKKKKMFKFFFQLYCRLVWCSSGITWRTFESIPELFCCTCARERKRN